MTIYYNFKDLKKHCPNTYKQIFGRRYLVPAHLQTEYATQDTVQENDFGFFLNMALSDEEVSHSHTVEAAIKMQLYKYNKPTIFVNHNLGEALMHTDLPTDMETSDINWPWPAMRLMLPHGLCTSKYGVQWLDIAKIETGEKLEFPFAAEFVAGLQQKYPEANDDWPTTIVNTNTAAFCGLGVTDYKHGPEYSFDDITWTGGWEDRSLQEMVKADSSRLVEEKCRQVYDPLLLERSRVLALNVLLLLNHYPFHEQIEVIRSTERAVSPSKIAKPELLKARFLSELVVVRMPKSGPEKGDPTGITKAAHWVRGHWHTVRYGTNWSQRRLQWFFPYKTGANSPELN